MDYRDTIQESLDYIEDNLDTEITAEELSSRAGFSLFYFYRLFQAQVGMPVMRADGWCMPSMTSAAG